MIEEHKVIQAEDLKEGMVIVDVRRVDEHDAARLSISHTLMPLDDLDPEAFAKDLDIGHEADIYILCRSGRRAYPAADIFHTAGYNNVYIIEGGILACEAAGHEIDSSIKTTV